MLEFRNKVLLYFKDRYFSFMNKALEIMPSLSLGWLAFLICSGYFSFYKCALHIIVIVIACAYECIMWSSFEYSFDSKSRVSHMRYLSSYLLHLCNIPCLHCSLMLC
uniref:Uncharacterized protein n=1 Tax=Arundo donax TaxID=35708 RepID=A0A0A9AJU3_ARUDO